MSMQRTASHPLLDFAGRYADPTLNYFNAATTVARLEALEEDLIQLKALFAENVSSSTRFHPWFETEIVSYFSVALVTCLEWHAKSRLTDLLEFKPTAITIEDVKGTISDKLVVQMVAQQATVIRLVGASVKISDLQRYLSVTDRVLRELRIKFATTEWLLGSANDSKVCWLQLRDLERLQELFDFRHMLVHELGPAIVGHPNVRETWRLDDALRACRMVRASILGFEDALTRFAPHMFPNLLTEDGSPVSSLDRLSGELDYLSAEANEKITRWNWSHDQTATLWIEAEGRFREYREAEEKFIARAEMLHWRYFDARTPLRERLLKYRLGMVEEVLSYLAIEESDNPNCQEDLGRPIRP